MTKTRRFLLYSFNARLLTVVVLVGCCLLAVLGRVFYLQVVNGKYFRELALSQQQRTVVLEPRRGKILDRGGRILAVSVPAQSLYAKPREISSKRNTAKKLSALIDVPYHQLLKDLQSPQPFVWIKRQLDHKQAQQVEKLGLDGIGFIREFRRYYPEQTSAAALIGFTGIDSQGLEGLEFMYQRLLAGKPQAYIVEKEGAYRTVPLKGTPERLPEQYSLNLTLDSHIQFYSEKALAQGVINAQADRGTVIVMQSRTGAVLAMATYPGFDPNRYERYSRAHFLNRAATTGYEPGSTFKLITVAASLNEGLISAGQEFFCENGRFLVGRTPIRDIKAFGVLTLQQVLQKSSNICAAKIGMGLPAARFHQYLSRFGFGRTPESGIAAEASGKVLPSRRWTPVDHANISFGQGILVSPLQMVAAVNVFANQGEWVPPYIVENALDSEGRGKRVIRDPQGKALFSFGPSARVRVIDAGVARLINRYMVSITQPEGTAKRAAIKGYEVAGKTGTSQIYDPQLGRYSNTRHIASFVGFVPASDPLITVLVVLRNPRKSPYGGRVAAPVFKEIASLTLNREKILPRPREEFPVEPGAISGTP